MCNLFENVSGSQFVVGLGVMIMSASDKGELDVGQCTEIAV